LTPRACLFAVGMLMITAVHAHRLSPGFFGLTETGPGHYEAQWKVSISGGLAETLIPHMPEGCEVAGAVRLYVLDDAQAPDDVRLQHASVVCDRPLAGGVFAIDGLAATATDVLLRIDYADRSSFTHRLVPAHPSVVIPARPGAFDVIRTYTMLGIEHILTGADHLLFVLGLLLLVRGIRRLVATITAFTVAHSITLASATLGFVTVSPPAVEAVIALSILFLATELARHGGSAGTGGGLTSRFPWVVAFSFGLLHGFGFAGALMEIGLPDRAIPLALLFFNVGVEIGQLVFIGAVVVFAFLVKRFWRDFSFVATVPAAYVIGSVSALWVFERTWIAIQPVMG
jgi:hypothetical protein